MLVQLLGDAGMSYDGYFWRRLRSGHGITKSTVERLLGQIEERSNEVLSLALIKGTVKELREVGGWSQEGLARECEVKRSTIEYAERGGYRTEQASELVENVPAR